MAIWQTFRSLFNNTGISNPDQGYQIPAIERVTTSSGATVTDERSLKIASVWACVQLITNAVSGLPIRVQRDTDEGKMPLKSKHYLTDLLHIAPNAWMKPRDFRQCMTTQMAIWNNAYAEIMWSGDRPVALMPLRPGRMTPFITADGDLTYHYQHNGGPEGGVKVYAARSILHLKGFGTDGVVGVGRNNYARETYGLSASADTYASKQFANGGRPGGVLTLDQFLKPEQREQVRELYSGLSEGAVNSGALWVLEGGMKYETLDFNADQMQMLGTRAHQVSEIARYFGVPDVLIGAGDKSASWPASFEQQMLMFLTHTIQPYLDEWEAALEYRLLPARSDICIDHDPSALVKMDSTAKGAFLSTLVQNGLMTRNEARQVLNLKEMSGADELTAQVNLTPVEDLGNVSQNADEAGSGGSGDQG